MLTALHFTSLKAWSRIDMECDPITGMLGTNFSGKAILCEVDAHCRNVAHGLSLQGSIAHRSWHTRSHRRGNSLSYT